MKKIITMLLLCFCLMISGCGVNIEKLIEEEKYEEAYAAILENEEEFGEYKDEVRYHLGLIAYENKDLDQAISYMDKNFYLDAMDKYD